MTFLHLAYLQQVSDLLEDQHKPLAARLGFIASKISAKHLVHVNGADPPKLRRCKACQAPITCDDIKSDKGKIFVRCSLCGFERHFSSAARSRPKQKKRQLEQEQDREPANETAVCADARTT